MSMVNYTVDGELYHHGIKGQRWGDRNYQYEDGSLTPEGRRRYYGSAGLNRFRFGDAKSKPKTKEEKEMAKANSAYRVERHKAKMERKTQEALNKEKIKKEQSNAKRNAIISKLKGNKPSAQVKKADSEGEEKRNDKKFEKNVKELLTAKKIKDYSKYTKEELEEAASRKEAENRIDAERRKSTKFGRAQEFFNSPAGQTLLNTTTREAIAGLSRIAESWGKQAIQSYLTVNAKEIYERSIDREGWEAKRASTIGKLLGEASQSRANAEKAWRQAEGEKLNNENKRLSNESQRLSNRSQLMKNKQLQIENERNNAEYEAQKGVREAKNKADIDNAKASTEEARANAEKAWRQAEGEKLKNENQSTKNKQLQTSIDRNNAEWEAQKGVREAKNKASIEEAKARQSEAKTKQEKAKASTEEAKVKQAEAKTKRLKEQTLQELEKSNQLGIRIDQKNFDEIGRAYRDARVRELYAEQKAPRTSQSSRIITDLSDVDLELLMKIINSRN